MTQIEVTGQIVRPVLYLSLVVPFVWSVVRALRTHWFPIGDSALLYLRAIDVGTDQHPWLGSWSSASRSLGFDINNPGPIYADLVAPFAHLFAVGAGNAIGVASVNLACAIGIGLAARRIGGPGFEAWALVVAGALMWVMGSELLFDMFQAHALLFPFLAVMVLMVGAVVGERWTWPWLVLMWSIVLETHVSYAYIAALLLASAAGLLWWRIRSSGSSDGTSSFAGGVGSRPALWSYAVLALCWWQAVWEQLFGVGEGNLTRLLRASGGTDVDVGLGNAFRMVTAVFALPPWWTRWGFADTIRPAGLVDGPDGRRVDIPWLPGFGISVVAFLVLLALLSIGFGWTRRHGHRVLNAVLGFGFAGLVGSVLALSKLTVGEVGLASHHTRWLFVLALWAHAGVVAAGIQWWLDQRVVRPDATRRVTVVALAAGLLPVFGVATLPKYTQRQGPLADTASMPALRQVFDSEPFAHLDVLQPLLYRSDNLVVYEPYSSAVMAQLTKRNVEFRVDDDVLVRQLGEGRRADGDEQATITQLQGWNAFSYAGDDCVMVRAGPLGPDADARLDAIAVGLQDRVSTAGLDLTRVGTAADLQDLDREVAAGVQAGDPGMIRRAVVEGWISSWVDLGLVDAPAGPLADLLADLAAARPLLQPWVATTYALVLSPATACERLG